MFFIISLLVLPVVAGTVPDRVQNPGPRHLPFNPNEVVERVRGRSQGFQLSYFEGEFLIDTNIVYAPAPNDQKSPSVGFDGTNYLVVWQDHRGPYSDIYGTRVTKNGTILDSAGIPISIADSNQGSPSVGFDGTNYLVVWEDYRSGFWDIYGARVTKDGTVLDPQGIPISTSTANQRYPSVGFDGTNYLVVWEDYRSGSSDIYGARVTKDGTVLDPNGIPISTADYRQESPSVGFDGTNYLVVWSDYRSSSFDIYGARVTKDGTVLDPQGIPISTATDWQNSPSVGFDGTNYLVVWQDWRWVYFDIYGARVTKDGTVLDPQGIPISTATYDQYSPSVGFDGTNYLVVWEDNRSGEYSDIYGARVTKDGTLLDPNGIPISTATANQWYPAVGFDGTNYLVVWSDYRSGSSDIYGARVTKDGTVLDPNGIPISTADYRQESPSVGFDGTNYLVVWSDYRSSSFDIYGARVTKDGTVLDPNGIPISTTSYGQYTPSVGFDGTNYLVVWQDDRTGESSDIYGARVTKDGTVLNPNGIPISIAIDDQRFPAVGFDGTNYFVVWEDLRGYYSDIYGARVTKNGTVLDPNGIPISTATDWQYSPSVGFDGTNYLVVWQDDRTGESSDIYGARVTKDGTVIDSAGIPISTASNDQRSPAVGFDGTNYLVVWQDNRSGYYSDIYGALVTKDGVVMDSGPIVWQEGNQYSPALTRGQGSQMFLVYQGWTGKVGNKTYNTYRIWGKMNPVTGIEERLQPAAFGSRLTATIVRNVLKLETTEDRGPKTEYRTQVFLVDITGRKVLELKPGDNDIRHLAPGVYFIKSGSLIDKKVVITR